MPTNHSRAGRAVVERRARPSIRPSVRIAYPKADESIFHQCYTFQIGATPDVQAIELCIDQGDWFPCREALGLWWYDWSGYDEGMHEAVARARRQDGTTSVSEARIFVVKSP